MSSESTIIIDLDAVPIEPKSSILKDQDFQQKLGMTATVELATSGNGAAGLRLPLTALVQQKGASAVWIVENGAVKLVPVQVVGQVRNDVLVSGQVAAGQKVVTAGVNLLKNGQKVRILTADVSRRADTEAIVSGEGRK